MDKKSNFSDKPQTFPKAPMVFLFSYPHLQ